MNADLERLIALQRLDSAADAARRRLADEPEREKALETRLESARQRVTHAKEQLTTNQTARREIDKEVAVHQGRLSKYREQAMAVKTNIEYHAIQKEIGHAQTEIKTHEDKMLEHMLEADDLTAAVKKAEADLAAEQKAVDADRKAMSAEHAELQASLEKIAAERSALVAAVDKQTLARFDLVSSRRNGIALAEARDGICTICHVRLRPQVFNNVRRNEEIVQCDSCNRILYFVHVPAPAAQNP
jgi:predicted  nucleic acid-binding Zn-ribbon protein